jgi:hypothetical protein
MESAFWAPAMQTRFGDNLLFAGKQQRTLQLGFLSATPDGLIINQPRDALASIGIADIGTDCFLGESKTIDPRTNLVEAKVENYYQTQVQLGLTRELTEYKPNYDVLTYMDASFWSEVVEFPIEFDPAVYQSAKDRATIIMTADRASDLSPEGWIAGGKECTFCPYVKPCGVARRSVPYNKNKKATPQFVAEITEYALQANLAEAAMLNQQAKLRSIQQNIKDRLREKGVRRIQGVVNWYEVAGAVRYSGTAMKKYLIDIGEDIEQFETTGDPSDRLTIAPIPGTVTTIKQLPGKLKPKVKKKQAKPKVKATKKTQKRKRAKTNK